jgi:N-acetylmuramoyl-L-alanine amidase
MKVVISAGHSSKCRGMSSEWLDEVDEARKVVTEVAENLDQVGVDVVTYWDDVSDDQQENLKRICDFHNSQGNHDLDVSVHFNASNGAGHGCEVFYTSSAGKEYAKAIVDRICAASGLTNRGAKNDDDMGGLYFLSHTAEVAVLIEVCFGDNETDCTIYYDEFENICGAISDAISDKDSGDIEPPEPEPPSDVLFAASGTCSTFGGPDDTGVSPSEGLAMWYEPEECPWLMLPKSPPGTTGMARRLDPSVFYIACRWDYDVTPKEMLRGPQMAMVTAKDTGVMRLAHIADWGPHEEQTGRAADLSPGLADSLGVGTDDEVQVTYPYRP